MLAVVAPGQGAQTPGMLTSWCELPGVAERLAHLDEVTGLDLTGYGTTADADTITDTSVAQPLIVAAGLLAAPLVVGVPVDAAVVGALAGHSVGELTAAALAGVLSADDAMRLVTTRGAAMAEAAARTPTGMTAVLGGDRDEVVATAQRHGLTAANENGAGQIVVAGTVAELEAFAADPPARARVRPLRVAGAFHTMHMAPAVDALRTAAEAAGASEPVTTLLSNAEGGPVADGRDALDRLVRQVSSPVRWDLVMATLGELGVTAVLELPPAGTLVGLVKRALPGVETVALRTPDDLDAARDLVARHGGPRADLPERP